MKTFKLKRYASLAWATGTLCILTASPLAIAQQNPFDEGTQRVLLSQEQVASLLEFAETSKARLEEALELARGKSFREANAIYLTTIKEVVLASYASKPRSELLMRHALNQALDLTFGVPTPNGIGVQRPGVLANTTNWPLLTLILKDSIQLALRYYEDDRIAIKNGKLLELPYMSFAFDRLKLASQWLASVMEWRAQYDFTVAILYHWLAVANSSEHLHRTFFAEELLKVDRVLKGSVGCNAVGFFECSSDVRELRGFLRQLQEKAAPKLKQHRR